MSVEKTQILLVEDDPDDADLLQEYLAEADGVYEVSTADRLAAALDWLHLNAADVILLDLSLPDATGLETFTRLYATIASIPIIVVTGLDDRELAVQAVQRGAQDYLTKGELHGNALAPAVRYAIERKRLESQVRDSEARYRALVETASSGVWSIDGDAVTTFVNARMAAMLGYQRDEMVGRPLHDFMSAEARMECERLLQRRRRGIAEVHDFEFQHRDGSPVYTLVATSPVMDDQGRLASTTAFITDVTERQHQLAVELACVTVREAVWRMQRPEDISVVHEALESSLRAVEVPFQAFSINTPDDDALAVAALAGGKIVEPLAAGSADSQVRSMITAWWEAGAPVYRPDLDDDDPYQEREPLQELFGYAVRAVLDVPFSHGTIAVNSNRPNAYCQRHIDALTSLASTLSDGFRRLADLQALQDKEDQLRQSQKMEAIGRLAGGVAHDFNNLITVISGYGQTLRKRVKEDERASSAVEQIIRAGDRAAGLVRQLLAFSRRQVLQPEVLDPGRLIADLEKMLRRLIGEDVDLVTHCAEGLGKVSVDPGQFEQVIINLIVNARDAMPHGGKLTVEAVNVRLDSSYALRRLDVTPGEYVMVAVSDTGKGMDAATLQQIFEPFFTTKDQGTGLGLSTVYGIVRQSGGYVWPYSEPGRGTTFRVYMPGVDVPGPGAEQATAVPAGETAGGRETILLVEDEDMVRELACETLVDSGYTVLEASDPEKALQILARDDVQVDLLVTDVVMPGMNGPELAACVIEQSPRTRILFTSGYMDREIVASGVIAAGTPFLQKPFNPDDLARKARCVLDQPAESTNDG